MEKYEQQVTCSKIECCGSYSQLPAEIMNAKKGLLISKRNQKVKNTCEVVANEVYTAKIERQYHLRRWEKERLARAAANV
jgi:hypothetical protein